MAQTATFTKLLDIREKDKTDAQLAYRRSVEKFEEVAEKIYQLLRKKEDAEQSYDNYLQQFIPLEKIKEQLAYIEVLNQRILALQSELQRARHDMNQKQKKLSSAHVEVKKFEKIIEIRQQSEKALQEKRDMESMDEMSIRQYRSFKSR